LRRSAPPTSSTPGRIRTYDQRIRKAERGSGSDPDGVISPGCDAQGGSQMHDCTPADDQDVPQTTERDPVEAALAKALERATGVGRWDVVAQLAGELQARRTAHQAPKVIDLNRVRAKRNGGTQ
jgi:hypothetical protein